MTALSFVCDDPAALKVGATHKGMTAKTVIPSEAQRWSRFFEQNFRVDKWNLCRD